MRTMEKVLTAARLLGRGAAALGKGVRTFTRALIIAIAIIVVIGVVFSFVGSIAQGWYFGRCDRPLGLCEERHIIGITMSRDGPPAESGSQGE